MLDIHTLTLLKKIQEMCKEDIFYSRHKDLCIAVRIALLNIKGRGIKLRPSLIKLDSLSDKKVASYILKELKKEVGPIADSESLRQAAISLVYKKLVELI